MINSYLNRIIIHLQSENIIEKLFLILDINISQFLVFIPNLPDIRKDLLFRAPISILCKRRNILDVFFVSHLFPPGKSFNPFFIHVGLVIDIQIQPVVPL